MKKNGNICLSQMLLLYLYVITILYLTFPLIVYKLYCVLKDPVKRMYDWTINFLELSKTDTPQTMKTILFLNVLIFILMISMALLIGGSLMILKHFPSSKLSGFVRRHLITDEDLEPLEGNDL